MTRRFVNTLKDGDSVDEVYLVADRQLRSNRNASLYLSIDLRDKTGLINGRMWNVTEELVAQIQTGGFARIRGKVQLFQGVLQLIIAQIYAISGEGLPIEEFESAHPVDIQQLLGRLKEYLLSISDPDLKLLMVLFLKDEPLLTSLCKTPAGVKAHHAYHGGLLDHIVTLLTLADRVATVYPEDLNRDLLLAGVFLHDIGKTRELSIDNGFQYTDEGQLLGHIVIGVEILTRKLWEFEQYAGRSFPEEFSHRLKHMVLSHHGHYEFGSPRLPMTPEAVALHHLDNLDAKVHEFTRCIKEDPPGPSHWTLFQPRLDRKLFKGQRTPAPGPDSSASDGHGVGNGRATDNGTAHSDITGTRAG